jgi:hypothetical protein
MAKGKSQDGTGSKGIPGWPEPKVDPASKWRPLTDDEKNYLRKWYSEEDLNNARVHDELPPFVRDYEKISGQVVRAITLHNDIYIKPGEYEPGTAKGFALLGHEMLHLQRYREGNMTYSSYLWSARHGYKYSPFEIEADKREKEIRQELLEKIKLPCSKNQ